MHNVCFKLVIKKSFTYLLLVCVLIFFTFSKCTHNKEVSQPCFNCPTDFRVTDYEPAWSRDGKYIAYVHGDTLPDKTGIYIITPDGKKNYLFHASAGAAEPNWSPDDQSIVFSDSGQIWKKELINNNLTQLTKTGANFFPSWSPDGTWIAYHRSYAYPEEVTIQGIWLLEINLNTTKQIFSGNSGYPFWLSKDSLSFITGVSTIDGHRYDSLWSYEADKEILAKISFLDGAHDYPKYSPITNMLVLTTTLTNSKPQIFTMNLKGLNPKELTNTQGYSCDWSPDGERITYTDSRAVNGRLWIMNSDGSEKKQITF